jgi:hypothetical protein
VRRFHPYSQRHAALPYLVHQLPGPRAGRATIAVTGKLFQPHSAPWPQLAVGRREHDESLARDGM